MEQLTLAQYNENCGRSNLMRKIFLYNLQSSVRYESFKIAIFSILVEIKTVYGKGGMNSTNVFMYLVNLRITERVFIMTNKGVENQEIQICHFTKKIHGFCFLGPQ